MWCQLRGQGKKPLGRLMNAQGEMRELGEAAQVRQPSTGKVHLWRKRKIPWGNEPSGTCRENARESLSLRDLPQGALRKEQLVILWLCRTNSQ